jgi:hypothetical protein
VHLKTLPKIQINDIRHPESIVEITSLSTVLNMPESKVEIRCFWQPEN